MYCDAERYYDDMLRYLMKLSDGETLGRADDKALRCLLDQYWSVKCPEDGTACKPNTCRLARPEDWVEYHGYTCAGELLNCFEYDKVKVLRLKNRDPLDALDAPWARRPSHYNP